MVKGKKIRSISKYQYIISFVTAKLSNPEIIGMPVLEFNFLNLKSSPRETEKNTHKGTYHYSKVLANSLKSFCHQ